ncbi:MAG TPA: hypothetical protein VFQ53_16835 [Kofleriaceae bacterium]|nr:hypothetical protein [Kofleriaceae bacterium]
MAEIGASRKPAARQGEAASSSRERGGRRAPARRLLACSLVVLSSRDLNHLRTRYRFDAPAAPPGRWLALLAIVATFAHHRLHGLQGSAGLEPMLARLGGALIPAHSAFVAWGGLLIVLAIYGVAQLREDQRRLAIHDRVSFHVVAMCALASTALVMVDQPAWLTTAAIVALAAVALSAYLRVTAELDHPEMPRAVAIPFALVLGYALVMAIAFLHGVTASALAERGQLILAIALVVGAAALALALGWRRRDAVLPGFVAWLLASIAADHRDSIAIVGAVLLAAAACAAIAVFIAATRLGAPAAPPMRRGRRVGT